MADVDALEAIRAQRMAVARRIEAHVAPAVSGLAKAHTARDHAWRTRCALRAYRGGLIRRVLDAERDGDHREAEALVRHLSALPRC